MTRSDQQHRQAERMREFQPFHAMRVLQQAFALERAGRSVIHLELGEPDFDTPEPIVAAGIQALREQRTKYTEALGLPGLRELIAADYGLDPAPAVERIAVTPGSSGALQIVFAALLDPGDQVLLTDPGYPCNANFVHLHGGVPVRIPCGPEHHYQLDAELIRRHWGERTRAVLLGTPANPTGAVLDETELGRIAATVRELGGSLIVDEIYMGLVFDDLFRSALYQGDDIFVVNGFSKYYGMTGWRLGWLISPPEHAEAIQRLCQNLFISAPSAAQYAALHAFEPEVRDELERRRQAFRRRRDFFVPALRGLGLDVPLMPQGAFYVYADVSGFGRDSDGFAADLLDRQGVAITPGRDFGRYRADEHVRFTFAKPMHQLEQAVERLRRFLEAA